MPLPFTPTPPAALPPAADAADAATPPPADAAIAFRRFRLIFYCRLPLFRRQFR